MDQQKNPEGLAWQINIWDRMVPVYTREIDKRFGPIVERVVTHADLKPGQHVLDLGTGTGSVALRAAEAVAPNGRITALDISPDMLALARRRAALLGRISLLSKAVQRRYPRTRRASTWS